MGIMHTSGPARLRAPRVFARARDKAPARQRGATFISWTAVAMMTVGAVGYLGSAPALSVFGLASVFLYVLPAIVFLLPASLVSAELASGWQGGVYNWVREGISAPMGLVAVWCQFAQTIFYYPALLAYVAGTLAYVINPSLANNGVYTALIHRRAVLGQRAGVLSRARIGGQARLERHPDRNPDSWGAACRSRRDLSAARQPFGGADGCSPRPAGMERAGQHRADRQQFLHLRRCGGQRRTRRRAARPGPRVPEGHVRRLGARTRRLRSPHAGDLMGNPH